MNGIFCRSKPTTKKLNNTRNPFMKPLLTALVVHNFTSQNHVSLSTDFDAVGVTPKLNSILSLPISPSPKHLKQIT